jgi:histidinol-phosphate aminotransferase
MRCPEPLISKPSRRTFLRYAGLAAAAPILTEAHFAMAAMEAAKPAPVTPGVPTADMLLRTFLPENAVLINANENPLGPSKAARELVANITAMGGRYDIYNETAKLAQIFAAQHNLPEDHVVVYPGSSDPLYFTVLAFTSPTRSLVIADPSYEAAMRAAAVSGATINKVALTADYAHDVKAMVSADPNAGVLYICNPNNPTGTLTSRADILWALEHKPKGSILMVDEAYIHLSDAEDVIDMVAAGKDIVVLRTFSKIYGMAGMRCGLALARPDLLARIQPFSQNFVPYAACAAAAISLLDTDLVPSRKKIIAGIRNHTVASLKAGGYKVIGDSQSNCFMIDTGRPGKSVIAAMQAKNVYIGRTWPVWPNAVRITVGTPAEMETFLTAFKQVMDAPPPTATTVIDPLKTLADPMRHAHFA